MGTRSLRCLLFSYYFYNEGYPSAHHLMDRLPLAASSGMEFSVISSMAAKKPGAFPQWRVPPVLPGDLRFVLRMVAKNSPRKRLGGLVWKLAFAPFFPLFLIERLVPLRDFTWSWCIPAAAAGLFRARAFKPDVLFSFGGRNSAHLAAAIVSSLTKVPWVAQLQDPIIHGYAARTSLEERFLRWIERVVMGKASAVIFMTDTARRVAEERTGCPGKGVVNYPGFDPGWFNGAAYSARDVMTILHVGSFSGSRNPSTFLSALAAAAASDAGLQKTVRFELLGNFGPESKPVLEAFPFPEMIRASGFVPRAEAYRRMAAADVLLLVQNAEGISTETIPSKFYEYLFAGRPILGLLYHNPELAGLLERWNHRAVELDNLEGIAAQLHDLYDRWRRDDLPVGVVDRIPKTSESAERLASILHQAVNGRRQGREVQASGP